MKLFNPQLRSVHTKHSNMSHDLHGWQLTACEKFISWFQWFFMVLQKLVTMILSLCLSSLFKAGNWIAELHFRREKIPQGWVKYSFAKDGGVFTSEEHSMRSMVHGLGISCPAPKKTSRETWAGFSHVFPHIQIDFSANQKISSMIYFSISI